MREALLTELLAALDGLGASQELLQSTRPAFAEVLSKYSVKRDSTELSTKLAMPDEVKWFLVAKKTDGMAESTLRRYSMSLGRFFRAVMKPLGEIGTNDIRVWLYRETESGKVSPRTLDGYRRIVCTFFRWCHDENRIADNPAANIHKMKYDEKKQDRLTLKEMAELRDACRTTKERAVIEMYYSTGMRCGELPTVRVSDLDLKKREVSVHNQKSRRDKVCYLTEQATYWVEKWLDERSLKDNDILFYRNRDGAQLNRNSMMVIVKRIAERTSIRKSVSPITLRRSMATHALNSGCDVVDVMKMLDHKNPKTTLIYAERYNNETQSAHDRAIA